MTASDSKRADSQGKPPATSTIDSVTRPKGTQSMKRLSLTTKSHRKQNAKKVNGQDINILGKLGSKAEFELTGFRR